MARRGRRTTLAPLPSLAEPPPIRRANRTAMAAAWSDPEDDKPTAARTARQIQGFRAYGPLRRCIACHGEHAGYTAEHLEGGGLAAQPVRRCPPRLLGAQGLAAGPGRCIAR
jgi:hypothetical protein